MAARNEFWIDDSILENDEQIAEWMTRTGMTSLLAQ
jgi:hypothetical protein